MQLSSYYLQIYFCQLKDNLIKIHKKKYKKKIREIARYYLKRLLLKLIYSFGMHLFFTLRKISKS